MGTPFYIMWAVIILYLAGALYSSYGPVKDKRIPDLRVSEYAPDLDSVPDEYTRKMSEKKRREEEYYRERAEHNRHMRELQTQAWEAYHKAVYQAKVKRMREGNPVTQENPLTASETPRQPMNYGIYY